MIRGAEFSKQASPKHPGTEKQLEQHWGCASYTGVPALYIPASLKPGDGLLAEGGSMGPVSVQLGGSPRGQVTEHSPLGQK